MRKLSCVLAFCTTTSLFSSQLPSALNGIYQLYYAHSSLSLNSTLGSLKDHRYSDAIWLKGGFSSISSNSSTLKVGMANLGYDHSFLPHSGQDFFGFNLEYSYSWLHSPKNTTHAYGASLYNTYLSPIGFYIDSRIKYLHLLPYYSNISSNSSHLFMGSLEMGWRLKYSYGFFLQPLGKISAGYGSEISLKQDKSNLHVSHSIPLFYQVGSYMGFEFGSKIKADISLGIFYDGDYILSSPTLEAIQLEQFLDSRLALTLESNILATQNLRFYLGGKTSFFGEKNTQYSAYFGLRILLGEYYAPMQKKSSLSGDNRNFKTIQNNMLYESEQSRRRIQERTHLKPKELQEQYLIHSNRNDKKVEDDIKYANRQRYLREKSRWKDIQSNEANYTNRTDGRLQTRSINTIRDYNKRELERKYGLQ